VGDVHARGGRLASGGLDLGNQPIQPVGAAGAEDDSRTE
jgi:hypothetical protein